MTDPSTITVVVAIIGSGGFGALVPWLLNKIDSHNPMRDGIRILLFRELQQIQQETVARGACPIDDKRTAEQIYDAYAALGGNGTGTAMNDYIQHAKIPDTHA